MTRCYLKPNRVTRSVFKTKQSNAKRLFKTKQSNRMRLFETKHSNQKRNTSEMNPEVRLIRIVTSRNKIAFIISSKGVLLMSLLMLQIILAGNGFDLRDLQCFIVKVKKYLQLIGFSLGRIFYRVQIILKFRAAFQ